MGKVVPFAPVRSIRVFHNFGAWTVLLIRKGKRSQQLGSYTDKRVAENAAARVRRIERIPSPLLIEPNPIVGGPDAA